MAITKEQSVGQMVADNPARARVFEKHRIDYCCGGKLTLSDACSRKGVNLDEVLAELQACDAVANEAHGNDWSSAALTELAEHIVSTHHSYLRTELLRIESMASRVAKVHGDRFPEMVELAILITSLRMELEDHLRKEEMILFPWIKKMETQEGSAIPAQGSVLSPITGMEKEHDEAGAALTQIRHLTNDYKPPMDACNTWRVLYASLEALEQDMHTHIHKENSILFPGAIELENTLRQS